MRRKATLSGAALALGVAGAMLVPASASAQAAAEAYVISATVDGAVFTQAHGVALAQAAAPGSTESFVARNNLPNGLGTVWAGHTTAHNQTTLTRSGVSIARVLLTVGTDVLSIEGIRAFSESQRVTFPATSHAGDSRIGRVTLNGSVIFEQFAPLTPVAVSLPGGAGTVTLFERIGSSPLCDGCSELEVIAIHVVASVQGQDVDVKIGSAYSGTGFGIRGDGPPPALVLPQPGDAEPTEPPR